MDVARVDRGLLIAAGSALVLIISLFLPWYAVSASLGPGVPAVSASVTGWESFSYTDLLLFLLAAVVIALAALTAAGSLPERVAGSACRRHCDQSDRQHRAEQPGHPVSHRPGA